MYKSIIVSLSLDHGFSQKALALAEIIKAEEGKITAVHVFEPVHSAVRLHVKEADIDKARQSSAEKLKQKIGDHKEIKAVTLIGHAARSLTDYAEKIGADCIIVGSHEPGLQDHFLGSTTSRILNSAKCAVHVLR